MKTSRQLPSPGQVIAGAVLAVALVAYPNLTDWIIGRWGVRALASGWLAVALVSFVIRLAAERRVVALLLQYGAAFALLGLAAITGDRTAVLLFPALVNAYLAAAFAASLRSEESMVERAARSLQPHLPDFTLPYCRSVTSMWAGFFVLSAVAIVCVVFAAPQWWKPATTWLYLGAVCVIQAAEFVFRKTWFRVYGEGPIDRFFARLFPAESTERGRRSTAYVKRMHELGYGPK